jgi:hypothetical protein
MQGRSAAIRQYRVLEEVLRRELDTEPEPETQRLYTEIRTGQQVARRASDDAAATEVDIERRLNSAIAGEDAGIVLFDFAAGTRGVFDGNRLVDHAADNRRLTMGELLLEGSEAVLRLDGNGRLFLRRHGQNDEAEMAYDWENRGFGGDRVYRLQRHVVDHMKGRGPVVNTARDYLANLVVENAVYESDRFGRRLTIPCA